MQNGALTLRKFQSKRFKALKKANMWAKIEAWVIRSRSYLALLESAIGDVAVGKCILSFVVAMVHLRHAASVRGARRDQQQAVKA